MSRVVLVFACLWFGVGFVSEAQASSSTTTLSLSNGWRHYGGSFAKARVTKQGTLVVVTGLVRGRAKGLIGMLPGGFRPPKHLIFQLNSHGNGVRVDVLPNGRVEWVYGVNKHGWISLSGIVFDIRGGRLLSLQPGWRNYGGGFQSARAQVVNGMVLLSGLIRGPRKGVVATLPAGYRPVKRHIFGMRGHGKSIRVDVLPNGQVIWVSGGLNRGWVSLSGMAFAVGSGRTATLYRGWRHYGGSYQPAQWAKHGSVVTLSGLVRVGPGVNIVTLPPGARPPHVLMFNVATSQGTGRLELLPTGLVTVVTGHKSGGWLSLSGVQFATATATAPPNPQPRLGPVPGAGSRPCPLVQRPRCPSGFRAELEQYQHGARKCTRYKCKRVVHQPPRPQTCPMVGRPRCPAGSRAELESYPMGHLVCSRYRCKRDLRRVPPSSSSSSVSIRALSLSNGWKNYGQLYEEAIVQKQDSTVMLSGVIRFGKKGLLGILPYGYRPEHRQVFWVNAHGNGVRVDVLPSGHVEWVAGTLKHGWLSLSGIVFETRDGRSLPLQNGWRSFGGRYQRPMFHSSKGLVHLSGMVTGPRRGLIATLPPGARPTQRIVFQTVGYERSVRVDILPNGQVLWVSGGRSSGWISLSGIAFRSDKGASLRLLGGWQNYSASYRGARQGKTGRLVTLSGLIRVGRGNLVARLPSTFRPARHVIFHTATSKLEGRIEISPGGDIRVSSGYQSGGWVSLSGLRFFTGTREERITTLHLQRELAVQQSLKGDKPLQSYTTQYQKKKEDIKKGACRTMNMGLKKFKVCVRRVGGVVKATTSVASKILGDLKSTFLGWEREASGLLKKVNDRRAAVTASAKKAFATAYRKGMGEIVSMIPMDWKLKVASWVASSYPSQVALAKRKALELPKKVLDVRKNKARLISYAKTYGKRFSSLARTRISKWMEFAKTETGSKLIQNIITRVARRQMDSTLRSLVARLAQQIGVPGPRTSGSRFGVDRTQTGSADQKDDHQKHGALYHKGSAFSLVLNLNGGFVVGGDMSIGVTWDCEGQIAGVFMTGGLLGAIVDAGIDLTLRFHPGSIKEVEGFGGGLGGSLSYYAGGSATVEWIIPFIEPIPIWGYGLTAGVGADLTLGAGYAVLLK